MYVKAWKVTQIIGTKLFIYQLFYRRRYEDQRKIGFSSGTSTNFEKNGDKRKEKWTVGTDHLELSFGNFYANDFESVNNLAVYSNVNLYGKINVLVVR